MSNAARSRSPWIDCCASTLLVRSRLDRVCPLPVQPLSHCLSSVEFCIHRVCSWRKSDQFGFFRARSIRLICVEPPGNARVAVARSEAVQRIRVIGDAFLQIRQDEFWMKLGAEGALHADDDAGRAEAGTGAATTVAAKSGARSELRVNSPLALVFLTLDRARLTGRMRSI